MIIHNSRFSLDERVVTVLDTKHSIYTLLPSTGLQLPCLSDTRHTPLIVMFIYTYKPTSGYLERKISIYRDV
jgi:hypothetical protein